jgi:hypothetical protein
MNKTKKHTITKKDKEKITKTISSYLHKHKEIVAAYLFRSYVTSTRKSLLPIFSAHMLPANPLGILTWVFWSGINLKICSKLTASRIYVLILKAIFYENTSILLPGKNGEARFRV